MTQSIAIVGMACRYPDAQSPTELWQNVLAQRRAFRRIPAERLRSEDYISPDPSAPDQTYVAEAAVIEGYEFDRARFRVAGSTFRAADLTHWLALDVADQALSDAGFPDGQGLPQETTGVFLGNTLTGEFSRSGLMRLRWPYVKRLVASLLSEEGWSVEQRTAFLHRLEAQYKEPFPPVGEESLAGGLSNTIAGRICNYFDLKGGGYTVDGACASSLLAITTACSNLVAGDLDVAVAGGVDLSLDPFELVGFAKAGALAPEEMRVYDVRSAGFWPGEGCGVVVLMRYEDAFAQGRPVYALIRGWGVSSDGSGGITRPEVEGQRLALQRAYKRAGFGIETVTYFEGHGTGTAVGDATELLTLSSVRQQANPAAPPAVVSSIKTNIGHTKAAAGVAGLIKAVMALWTRILPPTTGCYEPHPVLNEGALRILQKGAPWSADLPLRGGVSAMGFGGINTHLVLEGIVNERQTPPGIRRGLLLSSAQDSELLLLGARDRASLRTQVEHLLSYTAQLSRAEISDLAAQLAKTTQTTRVRAAVIASTPQELAGRLVLLKNWLDQDVTAKLNIQAGLFLGTGEHRPTIGFVFPGQGVPAQLDGGALRRRFPQVEALYDKVDLPVDGDATFTAVAQPAIATASIAALQVLEQVGLEACLGLGHSLGELTSLYWAGALDRDGLLHIVTERGRIMAGLNGPPGAMASLAASPERVSTLINGETVSIACLNGPRKTVISGEAASVAAVVARARAEGVDARDLSVSHAFHSPLVAASAPALARQLHHQCFRPLQRRVISTVTGRPLQPDADLRALLYRQITEPVRFTEAVRVAAATSDLFIEVGPGHALGGLIAESVETPVVSLDAGGPSLRGLWQAVGTAFALGASINHAALFDGRYTKPFNLDWQPRFLANPCERAPLPEQEIAEPAQENPPQPSEEQLLPVVIPQTNGAGKTAESPLELIRQLIANRIELPLSAVRDSDRLLSDLHLNSIMVSQLIAEAARQLSLPPPLAPTDFADVTVLDAAQVLEEVKRNGAPVPHLPTPPGIDTWVHAFAVDWVERPRPPSRLSAKEGTWKLLISPRHPLARPLQTAFTQLVEGSGVVVCLPPEPDETDLHLLLAGGREALRSGDATRFVLVQSGRGAAAFAKTLSLEAPGMAVCVIDVPFVHPDAVQWVVAEVRASAGYVEVKYDAAGIRREPVLRLLPIAPTPTKLPLGPADLLLVAGGGLGITAECALALARQSGCRLALLGRSQPAANPELAANLERMAAEGVSFRYVSADVTDALSVRNAVEAIETEWGAVTGILHGAARNVPQRLSTLDERSFRQTLAPKIQGVDNLLSAVDPDNLRLFVAFGSIIAHTGLPGEADYGVANEWLASLTERFQQAHPACRCLTIAWSVWAGAGMGVRLGQIESLRQRGILPIPLTQGVSMLQRLLAQDAAFLPGSVIVTGRFGEPPTVQFQQPDMPFWRFLEQVRVYYPGIELIVDTMLSADADPYLADHVFRGERLFPAVMGLEAMAQVAMALRETTERPVFESLQFQRPIVVPDGKTVTVRLVSLRRTPDQIEVALRCEETGFQVNHFQAICRFDNRPASNPSPDFTFAQFPPILLDSDDDLYGSIFFHQGRFRRVKGYRQITAKTCVAEIAPTEGEAWFSRYLPPALVLGDPGARDAAIHAIQVCVPGVTLLPVAVERITQGTEKAAAPRFVQARERRHKGNTFVYDVDLLDSDGKLRERWHGLALRAVDDAAPVDSWPAPLLGPYLERQLHTRWPELSLQIAAEAHSPDCQRRSRSNLTLRRLLGQDAPVFRRPDGRPETPDGRFLSVSHTGNLTWAVVGLGPVGCDAEPVQARSAAMWQALLGPERTTLAEVVAQERGEALNTAGTRVWAAGECLTKAGAAANAPLLVASTSSSRWQLFTSGPFMIATFVVQVRHSENELVLAVLVRQDHAGV